jgi:hypothetical protein
MTDGVRHYRLFLNAAVSAQVAIDTYRRARRAKTQAHIDTGG